MFKQFSNINTSNLRPNVFIVTIITIYLIKITTGDVKF